MLGRVYPVVLKGGSDGVRYGIEGINGEEHKSREEKKKDYPALGECIHMSFLPECSVIVPSACYAHFAKNYRPMRHGMSSNPYVGKRALEELLPQGPDTHTSQVRSSPRYFFS
jgi:hypothetical protein